MKHTVIRLSWIKFLGIYPIKIINIFMNQKEHTCYRIMGFAWTNIRIDTKDENVESIMFSQNGHHVTIVTSWWYQTTMFDSWKVKFIGTVKTKGLVLHS